MRVMKMKKKIWKWILDVVVWMACVYALVMVLLATRGPLEYLNAPSSESTEVVMDSIF